MTGNLVEQSDAWPLIVNCIREFFALSHSFVRQSGGKIGR